MADNILSLDADKMQKAIPMAKIIHREAAQLDFQLQNIFAAASIEAGLEGYETSNVIINDVFSSVLKKFQYDITNKNLQVTSNISDNNIISFITDSKKLNLILLNLLSNSIKHSPEGSSIVCKFNLVDNYLNIIISDDGEGISEENLDMIFNRFSRIDTTINSVTGGTGLGLSVVKALIELLNGNMNIVSEQGTKVSITLPVSNADDDNFEDDEILFDEELF
jgi:signal transduction histidine kinase